MFSSRIRWDADPNAVSALAARKRGAGAALLDLTESNPTRVGLPFPGKAITAAFGAGGGMLRYDPVPAGLPAARDLVAARTGAAPDRICLTASTSEAYGFLFKLLADPGGKILVPRPSYPLFEYLAGLECLRVEAYPLHYEDGWYADRAALEAAIDASTRAIVVVNPNNPTGSYFSRGEAAWLDALAARHGVAVIADEVFAEYPIEVRDHAATAIRGREALTFSLGGLSKLACLPQMKLGWIVTSGPGDLVEAARGRLEWIADTYLSVGAPVQDALSALLDAGDAARGVLRVRTQTNLAALRAQFGSNSAATVLRVEGGWSAVIRLPRVRSEESWLLELLDRYDVLAQPGYFYDFETEAYLIVSLIPEPAVFAEGAGRIAAMVATSS